MKAAAEKHPDSAHGATYRSVKRMIEQVIGDARLAFMKQHMLSQGLAGVFRVKTGEKSRLRIYYIASSKLRRATVLFIGYRKAGYKGDAYEEIAKLIRQGIFDVQFAELSVAKPR